MCFINLERLSNCTLQTLHFKRGSAFSFCACLARRLSFLDISRSSSEKSSFLGSAFCFFCWGCWGFLGAGLSDSLLSVVASSSSGDSITSAFGSGITSFLPFFCGWGCCFPFYPFFFLDKDQSSSLSSWMANFSSFSSDSLSSDITSYTTACCFFCFYFCFFARFFLLEFVKISSSEDSESEPCSCFLSSLTSSCT